MSGKAGSPRRRAILEAALRVIERAGVESLTHRAVAAEADVPVAATTYYFDSRDAIVREALALVSARSIALVEAHTAVAAPLDLNGLRVRLVGFAEAQLADREAPLVAQYELLLEAARRPELRPLAAAWSAAYDRGLTALVTAAGLPRAATAAEIVSTWLEGALLGQLSEPRSDFRDAYLAPQLDVLLAALAAPS
jgi:DNA-binding transcriptional regulator YbjK